jgi:peptide/nickel transport system substrate-binding protein
MHMSRGRLRLAVATTASALALTVAACGSSNSGSGSSSTAAGAGGTANQETGPGKTGGVLRQLGSSDVDYLDPGHTYYTTGYQVAYVTQRPLYSFKPGQRTPVPDLAQSAPQISSDLKTITVKIRPGVKFSPPVDREVTSKDVEYAFDRFFSANVAGQYPSYFGSVQGVPSTPTKGVQSISGVTTPDDRTIVFKLSRPEAVSVAAALVMPITMPVPEEYAKPFDAKSPSTYNAHVVATGPYMVKNDAKGNTVGYQPGKSIDLVRNPSWSRATDYRPAHLDEIQLTTNEADASIAAQQVLTGSHVTFDTDPPAAQLRDAVLDHKGQYVQVPSGAYRWLPLNNTIKPLDNVNVRKAILAAFDREAVRRVRGGRFIGDIATHFLPPGIPGFEEAGGLKGPPLDFLANTRGDMTVATNYMKKAGYPSGKYTGNDELLMVTSNADPGKSQAEVAKAQLEKLGLKVALRTVPQDSMYTEWCQMPAKKVAICGDAGWFKDFLDPQSMLEVTFKGSNIVKAGGNNNFAQLDDPKVDSAMDAATKLQGKARLTAWGNIDKMITADAPAVPLVWDKTTLIWSKDVQGVANEYFDTVDFDFTSLK